MTIAARTFSTLERYELKFHFPTEEVDRLVEFLKPWCEMDAYSAKSPDYNYWVTSLYLDSPQRTFYRWKQEQMPVRFNMRIRTYGENPADAGPRFFEIKHKREDVVMKTRATLPHGNAGLLWQNPSMILESLGDKDRRNMESFYRLSTTYNASPVLMTQYRRIAWFGIHEDYARVTLDRGMRWREERGYNYHIDPTQMRPSDLPEYFEPGRNAVLEFKCPKSQVPWWMLDLIREFNLNRRSFSKFGAATHEELRIKPEYRVPIFI